MPQNIQIALFVLGAVLFLIGFTGGNIKIFGVEVLAKVSNRFLRCVALTLGTFLMAVSFHPIVVSLHVDNSPKNNIGVNPSLSQPSSIPGVSIKQGDSVEVIPTQGFEWSCKGDATTNEYRWVGPGGESNSWPDERYMLPNAPFCSLIGHVGTTGAWHNFGHENTFTSDSSGGLYLTANDVIPRYCNVPSGNTQECYSDNKVNLATVKVNISKK